MRYINDLDVGTRLKNLRLDREEKMIDIALEFDISMAQYSRLESGKVRISVDVLGKACQYYNVSIDYILFGEQYSPKSFFFTKVQKFEEKDSRRFLKILSCLLNLHCFSKQQKQEPMYKIFAGGLLEMIPPDADNTMPFVLEYERNLQGKSENTMIEELGLTRFKWNSIMNGTRVNDVNIPLAISNQFGYDLSFLIQNKLSANLFFDDLFFELEKTHQSHIVTLFDEIITKEGEIHLLETQKRK